MGDKIRSEEFITECTKFTEKIMQIAIMRTAMADC